MKDIYCCCLSCKKPIAATLDTTADGTPFIHRDCPHCGANSKDVECRNELDSYEETHRHKRHSNAHDPCG